MAAERDAARAAIVAVAAGNFMVQLAMMPISAILPTIARDYAIDAAVAAWVMNAYLLTLTGLVLAAGRLGDLYGHRGVFSTGIAIYTLGALGAGLAPNLGLMIAARAIQGIGGAFMLGTALAIIVAHVPEEGRGRAIGLAAVAASLGSLLGLVIGSLLVSVVSWRWIFMIVVPAGVYAFWEAQRIPAQARPLTSARPDITGTLLLFLMLTALSLSFTHLHEGAATFEAGWAYHTGMQVLTGGLLAAFIVSQARARAPMMPLALFRHRRFTMAILANGVVHMTMMGSMFLVPFLVEQGMGRPAIVIGMLLAPSQLASMAASYASGWVYDRTRSRLLTPAALLAIAIGLGFLGVYGTALSDLGLLAILIGTGVATSIFMTANNTSAMASLPESLGGFGSGMLETSRQLGHTVAVALASGVLGLVAERSATGLTGAAAVEGFGLAIMSFAVVALVGVVFAALSGTPQPQAATASIAARAAAGPSASD